jgi:outer membrane protein TolC
MKLRLLTVVLLLAGTALAEPTFPTINSSAPLSLDSLISIGFANSPVLRQANLTTRLNSWGKLNAIGNFLPTVSASMSFSQSHYKSTTYQNSDGSVSTYPKPPVSYTDYEVQWGDTSETGALSNPRLVEVTRTIDSQPIPEGDSRSSSQSISLNESIFEGGRRFFLYRMAKVQENINNLNVEETKKNLAASIAQQAMLVLTQEKLLDLNKKLKDQKQDAYDLAKARFDVGAVTELDVLQAEIDLGSAKNAISSSERALQAQREALNQTLGIDLRSSFPLKEATEATPYEFSVDSLVSAAYGSRSDLRIAGLTVERSKYSLRSSQSQYLPTVSFGAQFSRSEQSGKNVGWTLSPRNINNHYSLNFQWNLFDGFSREYNLASQRVTRDQAIETERSLRLSMEKSVRDAYYNLTNVFNQLQITNRNRDLAERRLNLERERYRLGAASQLDLRDAQVVYAQAETDNLQKQLSYQSTLIALELAVGRSLR